MVPRIELVDQSDVKCTFRLSHFLTRMLFKFICIIFMLIVAQCVKILVLEVETLEKQLYVNFPLGTRVSVNKICWDYE